MQERWAVLLREEPSSKDYREAVSSNTGNVAFAVMWRPRLGVLDGNGICFPNATTGIWCMP